MKGEYKHSIDAKGRLAMPAKLRDELGERFTVTKGLDGCLAVYPEKEWEGLEERIRSLPMSKSRDLQRFFFSAAFDAELDAQGRILLPANLRAYAGLGLSLIHICRAIWCCLTSWARVPIRSRARRSRSR